MKVAEENHSTSMQQVIAKYLSSDHHDVSTCLSHLAFCGIVPYPTAAGKAASLIAALLPSSKSSSGETVAEYFADELAIKACIAEKTSQLKQSLNGSGADQDALLRLALRELDITHDDIFYDLNQQCITISCPGGKHSSISIYYWSGQYYRFVSLSETQPDPEETPSDSAEAQSDPTRYLFILLDFVTSQAALKHYALQCLEQISMEDYAQHLNNKMQTLIEAASFEDIVQLLAAVDNEQTFHFQELARLEREQTDLIKSKYLLEFKRLFAEVYCQAIDELIEKAAGEWEQELARLINDAEEYRRHLENDEATAEDRADEDAISAFLSSYEVVSNTTVMEQLEACKDLSELNDLLAQLKTSAEFLQQDKIVVLYERIQRKVHPTVPLPFIEKQCIESQLTRTSRTISPDHNQPDKQLIYIGCSGSCALSKIFADAQIADQAEQLLEVHVKVNGILYIDVDIEMPGVNLVISAEEVFVRPSQQGESITIDLSGRDAPPVSSDPAKSGSQIRKEKNASAEKPQGIGGGNGRPGLPGQSGGHFYLDGSIVHGKRLIVKTQGGRGTKGQNGGGGDDGQAGKDAINASEEKKHATEYLCAQDACINPKEEGAAGSKGGDGGRGGLGGEGGYAGDVSINKKKYATGIKDADNKGKDISDDASDGDRTSKDSLVTEDGIEVWNSKGCDGANGSHGKGGAGGLGGKYGWQFGYLVQPYVLTSCYGKKYYGDLKFGYEEGFWGTYKYINVISEKDDDKRYVSGEKGSLQSQSQQTLSEQQSVIKAQKKSLYSVGQVQSATHLKSELFSIRHSTKNAYEAELAATELKKQQVGASTRALRQVSESVKDILAVALQTLDANQTTQQQTTHVLATYMQQSDEDILNNLAGCTVFSDMSGHIEDKSLQKLHEFASDLKKIRQNDFY